MMRWLVAAGIPSADVVQCMCAKLWLDAEHIGGRARVLRPQSGWRCLRCMQSPRGHPVQIPARTTLHCVARACRLLRWLRVDAAVQPARHSIHRWRQPALLILARQAIQDLPLSRCRPKTLQEIFRAVEPPTSGFKTRKTKGCGH